MKIGVIKSKVEKILSESYNKGTFKEEIKNFNKNILSNKNISKLFFLYDELSENKGYSDKLAEGFIQESITLFENIYNKIKLSDLESVRKWVIGVNSHNHYKNIDNLFYSSSDVLQIENKINSKNFILETLKTTKTVENRESIMLPLSSMVKIANKTIEGYVESLTESERKDLYHVLKEDESILIEKYSTMKDETIVKLITLMENETNENIKETISEVIENVKDKNFDRIEYFRLKSLLESL